MAAEEEKYPIENLQPIPSILEHACLDPAQTHKLYNRILQIQIPFIIGMIDGLDYCFGQVIRLCYTKDGSVKLCRGYEDYDVRLQCSQKHRFIFYLIDLILPVGRHSEAVLIDTTTKTIEFFEPNGPVARWYPVVNSYLEDKFLQILPDYTYLGTGEFCPYLGPQAVGNVPLCASFSLFFLLLRIYNPDIGPKQIIDLWLQLPKEGIILLVESLVCYASDYAKHYNLYALQNYYDNLSSLILVEYPHLVDEVDRLYYAFDLRGMKALARKYKITIR